MQAHFSETDWMSLGAKFLNLWQKQVRRQIRHSILNESLVWVVNYFGSGFDPRAFHVRFEMDKVALLHASLRVLRFPLSISLHKCSIFVFNLFIIDIIKC